ncbi:MAG: YicC/YloC family endoribonuclease [Gemmataceae bacterium]
MLLSMTGFGEARFQSEGLNVAIELRSLNNRHLKVSVRATEPYNLLEPEFEKVIRRCVRRGTVQVNVRCERQHSLEDYRINRVALKSYVEQVKGLVQELNWPGAEQVLLAQALSLPGVVPEAAIQDVDLPADWPVLERVLEAALDKLQSMRQEEGRAMAQEFLQLRDEIARRLELIRAIVPQVATSYRDRLLDRIRSLLGELDVEIDRSDLIKEVAIYAERSDIAEEVVRLASHLEQFQEIMNEPESPGRKLEFLTQEMFREANTIGSKAGDVEISRHAVEIKATLEKMRELVQNVE